MQTERQSLGVFRKHTFAVSCTTLRQIQRGVRGGSMRSAECLLGYTVKISVYQRISCAWRVFRILTEPVPYTFLSVKRRNNEASGPGMENAAKYP